MIELPFNIKLTLSKKKKAPVLYTFEKTFLPHQFLHLLAASKWLKIIYRNDESVIIELYGHQIRLLNNLFIIFAEDWRKWEKYYFPTF